MVRRTREERHGVSLSPFERVFRLFVGVQAKFFDDEQREYFEEVRGVPLIQQQ